MTIKITAGVYGWRDAKGFLKPKRKGELCEVDDAEGERLCSLGVAESAEGSCGCEPEAEENAAKPDMTQYSEETLRDMKLAGLRILCDNRGAENPRRMTKAECIAFLLGEEEEELPEPGGAGEIVI